MAVYAQNFKFCCWVEWEHDHKLCVLSCLDVAAQWALFSFRSLPPSEPAPAYAYSQQLFYPKPVTSSFSGLWILPNSYLRIPYHGEHPLLALVTWPCSFFLFSAILILVSQHLILLVYILQVLISTVGHYCMAEQQICRSCMCFLLNLKNHSHWICTWKSVMTAVFCSDESIDLLSLTTRRLQNDYFHKYISSRINNKLLFDILCSVFAV